MRENLVFYNIQEMPGENCEEIIITFMIEEMGVQPNKIYSHQNIPGEIRIDVAHRVGKKGTNPNKPRPIVVKFVTRKGRDDVIKHARNLAIKRYNVSEQLPALMRERKLAQMDKMKELHKDNPNRAAHNIRFVKDTLLHNGDVVESGFEQNKLPNLNIISMDYETLLHSEPTSIQGSVFQRHALNVHSIEDAVRDKDALFQDTGVASVDHIIYAYRIDSEEGILETGNFDDGECGGSEIFVKCIQSRKMDNIFVAVSCIHAGPNLGKRRFQMIKQACMDVLNLI